MRGRRLRALAAAATLGLATGASAAQLTVGAGSALDLGTGSLDLGCAGLVVAGTVAAGTNVIDWAQDVSIQPGGTLNGESATLYVTGDWSNSGTFIAGTSSVNFIRPLARRWSICCPKKLSDCPTTLSTAVCATRHCSTWTRQHAEHSTSMPTRLRCTTTARRWR